MNRCNNLFAANLTFDPQPIVVMLVMSVLLVKLGKKAHFSTYCDLRT